MKRICISILLILMSLLQLYAPNLDSYKVEQKNREFDLISSLNDVLTNKLKDYLKFVEYESYKKESLINAINKILIIKAVEITEIGVDLASYNKLTYEQKFNRSYNKKEQALGLMQIRPVMYVHINKELKLCNYKLNDRIDGEKSINMFVAFQDHYNPSWNMEHVSRDWNGGGGLGMKKNTTLIYYKTFKKNFEKLQKEILPSV